MPASISELCEVQHITLAQLIDRCGIDASRTTAIYLGRWTPSPSERQRIADVFGVAVADIAWGHKTPIQHIYGHGPG